MNRSVILLGKGDLAIKVGAWFRASPQYRLAHVVPVVPEPSWTSSLSDWARAAGVPVEASGEYRALLEEGARWDLAFSVFYDKIFRADFFARCARILNLHNGPLPRYRGVAPINWALKNGEDYHGVTIHEVSPGVDAGPIVAQVRYPIYPDIDEVRDVYARGLAFGWTLFQHTMPIIDRIRPREQDESDALYYSSGDAERLAERRRFTRAQSR
jgi:methionyl-tRNA formyltransferase